MREERLRRGQAPFLLPTLVLVGGQPSALALAALAKRVLYPPAGWLEELDDRSNVKGRLTVTFGGDLPGGGNAVLLGRVKIRAKRAKQLPSDAQHGPLTLLGANARASGWQPFVLPLDTALMPDMIVQLAIDAPLSRLLLGRGG